MPPGPHHSPCQGSECIFYNEVRLYSLQTRPRPSFTKTPVGVMALLVFSPTLISASPANIALPAQTKFTVQASRAYTFSTCLVVVCAHLTFKRNQKGDGEEVFKKKPPTGIVFFSRQYFFLEPMEYFFFKGFLVVLFIKHCTTSDGRLGLDSQKHHKTCTSCYVFFLHALVVYWYTLQHFTEEMQVWFAARPQTRSHWRCPLLLPRTEYWEND